MTNLECYLKVNGASVYVDPAIGTCDEVAVTVKVIQNSDWTFILILTKA